MRSLHRWLSTIFVLVLLFLGTTGLMIQADDLLALHGLGPNPAREIGAINGGAAAMDPRHVSLGPGIPDPTADQTPLPADTGMLLAGLLPRLHAIAPYPVASIALAARHGVSIFTFTFTGPHPPLALAAPTAAVVPIDRDPLAGSSGSFHDEVKAFHSGGVLAAPGIWLIFATGASLFILSLSGLYIYAQMWSQRRDLGRHGLFWR